MTIGLCVAENSSQVYYSTLAFSDGGGFRWNLQSIHNFRKLRRCVRSKTNQVLSPLNTLVCSRWQWGMGGGAVILRLRGLQSIGHREE